MSPPDDEAPRWPADVVAHFEQYDPPGRAPGVCWRAELHDADAILTYPVATAYVTDLRDADAGMIVDFLLVPDHLRRLGYASRLLGECRSRWPDLVLTGPISEAGEGLLRSLGGDPNAAAAAAAGELP